MVDEFSSFARMPKPAIGAGGRRRDGAPGGLPDAHRPSRDRVRGRISRTARIAGPFDRRLVSQAVTNIVKNATEAIAAVPEAERGAARIRMRLYDARPTRLRDLAVTDNGKGFPAEDRQRLLEPYMTTREGGTGLGLPIVGKILEEHGGRHGACATTRPSRGGQVRCGFRRSNPAERAASIAVAERAGRPMSADILIVDDEADIRELVAGILEDEGHGRGRPARRTRRSRRSKRGARNSSFSTSGCRAAAWTACRCSSSSRREHPDVPVVMISGPRQHRDGGVGDQARRLRLYREAVQGGPPRARRRAGAGRLRA